MRIGCVYTSFHCKDYIKDSLNSWIKARNEKLDGNEFLISAVSVRIRLALISTMPPDILVRVPVIIA